MERITTGDIQRMNDTEGLILQGCGGNPDEWLSGINELFTKEGILRDGGTFKDAYVFEHGDLTNILFSMEDVKLDIGKLAIWRIATHDTFGGTWLSDYIPNKLGIDSVEREPDVAAADIEPEEDAPPIVAFGERPSPYRDGFYSDGPHPDDGENANDHLPLRVYVENIRDERLGGFTMPFPATAEDLRPFLEKIEIKGGQDIKVCEVLSDVEGLGEAVTEAMNKSVSQDTLNELNYLAVKIDAMQPQEYNTFAAALEAKRHCGSIAEIINLTENPGSFDIQPAFSAEQYGEFLIETEKDNTSAVFDRLEHSDDPDERAFSQYILRLEAHVDAAAYGHAVAEEEKGAFTERGYLTESGDFKEVYRGPEDIPAEYRVYSPTAQAQEKTADEAQQLIAPGIKSDEMLGRFLYDNKMLPEKDLQAANARLSFTAYPEDCYRMIGKRRREAENGSFTQAGYVGNRQPIEKPPVMEHLAAVEQQTELAAGTIPAPIRKVENTDLTTLLAKMHVLGGDYAADIHHNLNVLEAKQSAEYLLLMNGRHAFLTEAAHVYRRGADSFDAFMNAEEENINTRIFALHVTDVHKEHVVGDLVEMNVRELQLDLFNHSIRPVRIDATPKFGLDVSYTPEDWSNLEDIDRHMLQSWTRRFDPADSQAVIRHLEEASDKHAQSGTAVSSDELLSILNAICMEEAENPQPNMLRIPIAAAKDMLTHGDAAVYRLLPQGAKELSPLDAMQSRGGLWYQEYREFAVKKDAFGSFDKWARREAEAVTRRQPERAAPDKPKQRGPEL